MAEAENVAHRLGVAYGLPLASVCRAIAASADVRAVCDAVAHADMDARHDPADDWEAGRPESGRAQGRAAGGDGVALLAHIQTCRDCGVSCGRPCRSRFGVRCTRTIWSLCLGEAMGPTEEDEPELGAWDTAMISMGPAALRTAALLRRRGAPPRDTAMARMAWARASACTLKGLRRDARLLARVASGRRGAQSSAPVSPLPSGAAVQGAGGGGPPPRVASSPAPPVSRASPTPAPRRAPRPRVKAAASVLKRMGESGACALDCVAVAMPTLRFPRGWAAHAAEARAASQAPTLPLQLVVPQPPPKESANALAMRLARMG